MSAAPPLGSRQVARLNEQWGDGSSWIDVLTVAANFWNSSQERRTWAWHHLLLAVGNFKRQARISPPHLAPDAPATRSERFLVPDPDLDLELVEDDPETWEALAHIPGLGVATTTTLLSALWPESHWIMDRRSLTVAYALSGPDGVWPGAPAWNSRDVAQRTWSAYEWYRTAVLDLATQARSEPLHVERSLYEINRTVDGNGTTWPQYRNRIVDYLRTL